MKIHVFFIGQVILLDQKTGIQIPPLCHSPKYNSPKIAEPQKLGTPESLYFSQIISDCLIWLCSVSLANLKK